MPCGERTSVMNYESSPMCIVRCVSVPASRACAWRVYERTMTSFRRSSITDNRAGRCMEREQWCPGERQTFRLYTKAVRLCGHGAAQRSFIKDDGPSCFLGDRETRKNTRSCTVHCVHVGKKKIRGGSNLIRSPPIRSHSWVITHCVWFRNVEPPSISVFYFLKKDILDSIKSFGIS